MTAKAPITETLAAALLMLTPWRGDRILVDPFCGSGNLSYRGGYDGSRYSAGKKQEFSRGGLEEILIPRKCWYDAMTVGR